MRHTNKTYEDYIKAHWHTSKPLAMAYHLGCCERNVYRIAEKLGLYAHLQRPKFTKRITNRIETLYAYGMSDNKIAEKLGVAKSAVSRHLRSKGLPANGKQWKREVK